MRFSLPSTIRGRRAVLPLIAVALLSPQRAAAECGSHVTVLNPTAESHRDTAPTAGTEPAKSPCQGPHCSDAPERHPPTPPAPAPVPIKELVTGAGLPTRGDPPHFTSDRERVTARPVHHPLSIFHPPRTA